ncbi:MAG: hypothetical protein ABJA98_01740 [Acidobacteriota bacterium]
MNDDFDDPEQQRLTLTDGKYVDIKKRLNHGETEDLFARISPYGVGVNRREVRTAKIEAYLLGWNLTKKGVPVPMSPDLPENVRIDTIRAMTTGRAVEIHQAIEAHEAAMEQAAGDLKKTRGGTPAVDPISPLPSAPAGPSDTSVN